MPVRWVFPQTIPLQWQSRITKLRVNGGIPKIKYVITLDADTELTLNSGIELIQAMAHPLNRPIISEGRVVSRTPELCSQGLGLI